MTNQLSHNIPSDELPSAKTQLDIAEYPVFDREGKELPFREIYSKSDRTLIIFVRHFFCDSCQAYLQHLSPVVTPDHLAQIPVSTSIAIVGCGDPRLIDGYAEEARCSYPIYTDPTRKLYDALGMIQTMSIGARPEYISKPVIQQALESIWQGLRQLPNGLAHKGGPGHQQGGEVLYERTGQGDERQITWIHRMQRSWGRIEVRELAAVVFGQEVENPSKREVKENASGGYLTPLILLSGAIVGSLAAYKSLSRDTV